MTNEYCLECVQRVYKALEDKNARVCMNRECKLYNILVWDWDTLEDID